MGIEPGTPKLRVGCLNHSATETSCQSIALAALGRCSVLIFASPCAEVSTGPRAFGFFEVRGPGRRRRGAEVSPFAGANYFLC